MSFAASVLLTGDASGAKKALGETRKALIDVDRAANDAGRGAQDAATDIRRLGSASEEAATGARTLANAQNVVAIDTRRMAQAHAISAGEVANLTAQFNDIGVMLAAGQSPLQLAIRQGSQIGQVLGPRGVAGAVTGLGRALLGMLSPINLLTIGGIALGATAFQWITQSEEDAADAVDAFSDMEEAARRYFDAIAASRTPLAELRSDYGDFAREAKANLQEIADLEREAFEATTRRTVASVVPARQAAGNTMAGEYQLADLLTGFGAANDLSAPNRLRRGRAEDLAAELEAAFAAVDAAMQGTLAEQAAGIEQLVAAYRSGAEYSGQIDDNERAILMGLREQIDVIRQRIALEAEPDEAAAAADDRRLAAYRQYAATRLQGEQDYRQAASEAAIAQAAILAQTTRAEGQAARQQAQEMIEGLQAQAEMQRLVAVYGEDSVTVARARVAAERDAYEQTLDGVVASDDLKAEIMAAWDAANGLAGVDVAGGIWAGADAASAMAANLAGAVAQMDALRASAVAASTASARRAQNRLDTVGDPIARAGGAAVIDLQERLAGAGADGVSSARSSQAMTDAETAVRSAAEEAARLTEEANAADAAHRKLVAGLSKPSGGGGSRSRGGRGGGGRSDAARAAEREREAVERLLDSLRSEVDILRETDPVQQELLRHRDALRGATAAERAEVEDLIRARDAEAEAARSAEEGRDFLRSEGYDLLRGSVDDLGDAFDRLKASIADAAFEAAILGTGPLAGIFGGAGGGLFGMIGGLFGGGAPAGGAMAVGGLYADGGMIYGAGGPRDDGISIRASAGEFIVNARATARHRDLLEAINSGHPAFRDGGAVGGGSAARSAPGGLTVVINQTISANGDEAVARIAREETRSGVQAALKRYDVDVLPASVKRINRDPRRIGG